MAVIYTKLQAIKDELEQLKNDFSEARLSSLNITHNLNNMAKAVKLYEVYGNRRRLGLTPLSK